MNNSKYYVSTDKSKLNIEKIKVLLKQSYWANERTEERILKSVENSICYGIYTNNDLVGFGRVVTDYSTVYWICDIIVDEDHRGKGLGKKLMENIMAAKELEGLLGILATEDAHGLYEQYGFIKEPRKFMIKKRAQN
ncbi:MAG: GCN5 family acetyltransferase [Clostridia bacterium BRH_c25]|nr:MAG: GCN5 family acetyltransferase [Clostridia bacterium BRH_c25]